MKAGKKRRRDTTFFKCFLPATPIFLLTYLNLLTIEAAVVLLMLRNCNIRYYNMAWRCKRKFFYTFLCCDLHHLLSVTW
jgi:hypothetical protein